MRLTRSFLFALGILPVCFAQPVNAADVTFRVRVPAGTAGPVHIAGSFQGWNPASPAHALTETEEGLWTITLDLPEGATVEYKFALGAWDRAEKLESGAERPNRSLTPAGDETIDVTIERWSHGRPASTITGDVTTFTDASFLDGRRVWVYLPPGYHDSDDRYPVLYMHDGQNVFDAATSYAGEWQVDETCERLIAAGEIEHMIVVAIDNAGAGRVHEYTPWPEPTRNNIGGGAAAYLATLRDDLIPLIDERYRTHADAEHRALAGSSLGGLVSAYAALTMSDTWSRFGCFSSSYWWAGKQTLTLARDTGRPDGLARLYHDHGTEEQGVDILREMTDVLHTLGFTEGEDLMTVVGEGHGHNEPAWAERFPAALRFLFADSASP